MLAWIAVVAVVAATAAPLEAAYNCPAPGFKPFDCPEIPTPPQATHVRQLQPGNIKAVMALGDSITAGFAMKDLPLEYRGLVYSTGGDDGALTIGNFLKHYSPKLKGQCKGTTIPLTHDGKGLNLAVSGAVVRDLPGQIDKLVERLATAEYRDLSDEWKLLTIFIGANDICDCKRCTPEQFEKDLRAALDKIHSSIPKVFINTMTIFNISQVWTDAQDDLYCRAAVPTLHECDCLTKNASLRLIMDELALKINSVTEKVAADYYALNDPTFTVVNQPAVDHVNSANFGKNVREHFLSDVDCFHPSLCADQAFAVGVWNNMFTPPAQKKHTMDPAKPDPIYCPKAGDIIQ